MRYVPSKKLQSENIDYEGISGNFAWVIWDGALAYLTGKYRLKEARTILDIGCGSGAALDALGAFGAELYGIDINNYLSTAAKKRVAFSRVDLNFEPLPYKNDMFDVVTAFQTIEHLENPFHVMREVKRVLKADGYFIWSVPNPYQWTFRVKYLLTGNMPPWTAENDHLLFLTKAVLKKTYLAEFTLLEEVYQHGAVPFWGRLQTLFGKKLIPYHHLMVLPRSEAFGRRICYVMQKK